MSFIELTEPALETSIDYHDQCQIQNVSFEESEPLIYIQDYSIYKILRNVTSEPAQQTKITSFLRDNSKLVDLIQDGFNVLKKITNSCVFSLWLSQDPEEDWDVLFLNVEANLDLDESLEIEDEIFDDWYGHLSSDIRMKFNYRVI